MESNIDMPAIAQDNGYKFVRKGCPCNGTPYVYQRTSKDGTLELWLYNKRRFWDIRRSHYVIDKGTDNVLQEHLKLWD